MMSAVPFSTGTERPRTAVAPRACDCHVHVYDAAIPGAEGARLNPPPASVDDYRRLQSRIGTSRVVLVTPSTYGTDNRAMLAGLRAFGADARGVAVIAGDEPDAELQRLHAALLSARTLAQDACELLKQQTGVQLIHSPYKGDTPALQDTLAGVVNFMFAPAAAALPHIASGKLRALAVTSAKRLKALPDVPTMTEAGFHDFVVEQWQAVYAPSRTPAAIVNRLNSEIGKALKDPAIEQLADKLGVTLVGGTPEQLARQQEADSAKWAKVIRDGRITVN